MRRSHHTDGSEQAQSTLMALAGWAPSRRSILTSLLSVSAAVTAIPVAAAIPDGMPEQNPYGTCSREPAASVSPRMAQLVADFIRLTLILNAADFDVDPAEWNRAAEERSPALEALVFERPSTVADLAAKMTALAEFMQDEDTEFFTFRRLAEDATMLVGSAAK